MKDYKWELRSGSKKEFCPQCGKKRFVPYVAKADGKTLAGEAYGRCDREQNCGYHRYPGKDVSDEGITPIVREPEPPLYFYPAAVQVDTRTPLFDFACKHWLIGPDEALRLWNLYRVGADGNRTVFWQISKNGDVRAGKSIPYKADGHRDKSDKHPANWCHYSPRFDGLHTGKEMHQCFFGEHLLTTMPDAQVRIVESEKTAIFMASIFPKFVWLACGGSQGLSEEKMKVLEGRDVKLFPDNGQFDNWAYIAQKHYFEIDRFTDLRPVFEGCDLLDYFTI